jgi:ABC transporter transmembrane region
MFICTYIYIYTWVHTAESTAKRIRERYLKAILRQDIAFFDKVGAGEITTRIQTDTRTWFFPFWSHIGLPTDTAHTQIWSNRVYQKRSLSWLASSRHLSLVSSWRM